MAVFLVAWMADPTPERQRLESTARAAVVSIHESPRRSVLGNSQRKGSPLNSVVAVGVGCLDGMPAGKKKMA